MEDSDSICGDSRSRATVVEDVVDLTEDATTLTLVFQYVVSSRLPKLSGLDYKRICRLLEAAQKYDILLILSHAGEWLAELCSTQERSTTSDLQFFIRGCEYEIDQSSKLRMVNQIKLSPEVLAAIKAGGPTKEAIWNLGRDDLLILFEKMVIEASG